MRTTRLRRQVGMGWTGDETGGRKEEENVGGVKSDGGRTGKEPGGLSELPSPALTALCPSPSSSSSSHTISLPAPRSPQPTRHPTTLLAFCVRLCAVHIPGQLHLLAIYIHLPLASSFFSFLFFFLFFLVTRSRPLPLLPL